MNSNESCKIIYLNKKSKLIDKPLRLCSDEELAKYWKMLFDLLIESLSEPNPEFTRIELYEYKFEVEAALSARGLPSSFLDDPIK